MIKKASDFDEFFVATLLADLFDPSSSDDMDFVAQQIVKGLEENGIVACKDIKVEDIEDGELLAS